jgi:hypothetical protein
MRRHVALVWTDVSEEHVASFIRKKRLSKLGTVTYLIENYSPDSLGRASLVIKKNTMGIPMPMQSIVSSEFNILYPDPSQKNWG